MVQVQFLSTSVSLFSRLNEHITFCAITVRTAAFWDSDCVLLYVLLFVGKRLHRFSYWCNLMIKRQMQSHTQMEVSFGAVWRLSVSPEISWTSRLQKIQTANLSTVEQLLFYRSANPWFQTPIPNSEMPHKVQPVLKYLKKIFLSATLKHIFYSELCA